MSPFFYKIAKCFSNFRITSTIRRETPAMDEIEFEKLDRLTNGKFRHFLVGSPSGYKWSEQVETILTFENLWKEWERIPSKDTKMLPKHRRQPLLESKGLSFNNENNSDKTLNIKKEVKKIEDSL